MVLYIKYAVFQRIVHYTKDDVLSLAYVVVFVVFNNFR